MPSSQKSKDYDFPLYLFHQGKNFEAYRFFGAHLFRRGRGQFCRFRVWAPHAKSVSVIGSFNNWDRSCHPMEKITDAIWEAEIPRIQQFDSYKYSIETEDGRILDKADPYGSHYETRPGTASKIYESSYTWKDAAWYTAKKQHSPYKSPMNIYEANLASWKHKPEEKFPSYVGFAEEIIPYLKKMSYTHIELMPLTEYPFDGSWGYQVTGYFAPTSRHGTPDDFRTMIDMFHQAGIGVILDWVPAHFPKDPMGLCEFDGSYCYEYADPLKMEHKGWGTRVFDYGKGEVCSFLISSACCWLEEFHVDGLRVDAVASMLYLDYDRPDGEWRPNVYGGNENLEAVEFLRHLNEAAFSRNPDILMIAEESTAWPKVTGKPEEDGLGFSHKWNMGWMNDFLEYMKLDPYFRKWNHNKMTFSMTYAYAEKYILVLSHDEVVHLKCSMINKMPGLYDDKFANLRAGYAYMLGHPGKKLLFMGQEFAQLQEWSEARELDWYLLAEDKHQQMQNYVKALLHLYKKTPALYDADQDPCGFEWINADDADRSIFSFVRHSKDGKSNLLFVINFTPVARPDYRVGVPKRKQYRLVLDGDAAEFGGNTTERPVVYKAVKSECDGREYSFAYDLPAYGIAIFKF